MNVSQGTVQLQASNALGNAGTAVVAGGAAVTVLGTGLNVPQAWC